MWHWCFWDVRFVHKMQHELFLMAKRRHFYLANFWGTRKIGGILDDPVVIDAIIACFILPWTSDFTRGNDLLNSQYNKVLRSFSRLALFGEFSKVAHTYTSHAWSKVKANPTVHLTLLKVINIKFLLVISIFYKTEWPRELRTWSLYLMPNKISPLLLLKTYGDNKWEFLIWYKGVING